MSANLNEVLNAEQVQRRCSCSHCHIPGHNINHCRRARSDGHNLHLRIVDGLRRGVENPLEYVRLMLSNMTVHQLKILMMTTGITPRSPFAVTLQNLGMIPFGSANSRLKQDRIAVMLAFYSIDHARPSPRITPPTRKISMTTILVNPELDDSVPFDCPICVDCKPVKEKTVSNCNHTVCKTCMENYLDHHIKNNYLKRPCCSLCRADINTLTFTNQEFLKDMSNKYLVTVDDIIN